MMHWKLSTLLFFMVLVCRQKPLAQAKPDSSKTRVYIIGVVHEAKKFRNADSLLLILRDIKPDLILSEMDTLFGYFDGNYELINPQNKRAQSRQIRFSKKAGPEIEVLYRYRKEDSSVRIHPFDIDIPNRENYTRQEHDWIEALEKAHHDRTLPQTLDSTYNAYMKLFDLYYDMHKLGYRELNRKSFVDSIGRNQIMEEQLSKKLVTEAPQMAAYRDWQTLHFMNWNKRNEVMVQNILRFIEKTKAKKVVVFTGILHKPYQRDQLAVQHTNLVLMEYFNP
jgi:hypothetical protein